MSNILFSITPFIDCNWILQKVEAKHLSKGYYYSIQNISTGFIDYPIIRLDHTIAYDFPERIPKYVQKFIQKAIV